LLTCLFEYRYLVFVSTRHFQVRCADQSSPNADILIICDKETDPVSVKIFEEGVRLSQTAGYMQLFLPA
jgi:hypothetical protein